MTMVNIFYTYYRNHTCNVKTFLFFRQSKLLFALLMLPIGLLISGCDPQILIEISNSVPQTVNTLSKPVPPGENFQGPTPTPLAAIEEIDGPITLKLSRDLPEIYSQPILAYLSQIQEVETGSGPQPLYLVDGNMKAGVEIALTAHTQSTEAERLWERFFAVVVPFDTVQDNVSFQEIQQRWQDGADGEDEAGPLYISDFAAEMLPIVLGDSKATVVRGSQLLAKLEAEPDALGIVEFDQLDPRFKVLYVDGINLLDNQFVAIDYPLAVSISSAGVGGSILAPLLKPATQPYSNRNPDRLTTLLMTGVTAMSRGTAVRMEEKGYDYPARVISSTLRAADITHISNEVPFLDDCVANNTLNNLVLCSHTNYWETLEAVGTDIVSLSGNHVNDFGYDGAYRSIRFYRDNGIPIYGSGLTVSEACAPLVLEHNGNKIAFLASLAFDPYTAWATSVDPGACYYYYYRPELIAHIDRLSEEVDVIAFDIQYYETYNPYPTYEQIREFRELRDDGVHILTGVQSHVPQAMEPYGEEDEGGSGMILYGLGNLFFDQMWSWETRTELMARHTIYEGRLISTEILTAVLEDYAQPRWAEPEERREILERIFEAAPDRPVDSE